MSDLLGQFFISDCRKYIAVQTPDHHHAGSYDVIAVDGSRIWLAQRYQAKSFTDKDPRRFPEYEHMVHYFGNNGYHTRRTERWVYDFELGFADYNVKTKKSIAEYRARFRKQINFAGRFKP